METQSVRTSDVIGYEEDFNAFLTKCFGYMTLALIITAGAAYVGSLNMVVIDGKPQLPTLSLAAMVLSLIIVLSTSVTSFVSKSSALSAGLFILLSLCVGYGFSPMLIVFTGASLFTTFLAATCVFGGMAIIGLTTKYRLTGYSRFFLGALIGLIVVGIANTFIGSSGFGLLISAAGVLLFAALTAYDVQKLKVLYNERAAVNSEGLAIYGALTLYLDILNLYLLLLRFMGVPAKN